jgi:2-succinyl-5-enolpyruvyl-6-hydroxy-3-cyclohexene-1-carboxylate synthase
MTELLRGDADSCLRALGERLATSIPGQSNAWRRCWSEAAARARRAVDTQQQDFYEGAVARALIEAVGDDDTLVVGNSMPIRDVDTFVPACEKRIRILTNRGANGIDGLMSTALGAASTASGTRTWLLIGDLSLLHDVGALQTARRYGANLTVVVVNNDGGGVFSFLPKPAVGFEELFATPHGLELGPVVKAHGIACTTVADANALALALGAHDTGPAVVEVRIDRHANAVMRERVVEAAALAIYDRDEAAA